MNPPFGFGRTIKYERKHLPLLIDSLETSLKSTVQSLPYVGALAIQGTLNDIRKVVSKPAWTPFSEAKPEASASRPTRCWLVRADKDPATVCVMTWDWDRECWFTTKFFEAVSYDTLADPKFTFTEWMEVPE